MFENIWKVVKHVFSTTNQLYVYTGLYMHIAIWMAKNSTRDLHLTGLRRQRRRCLFSDAPMIRRYTVWLEYTVCIYNCVIYIYIYIYISILRMKIGVCQGKYGTPFFNPLLDDNVSLLNIAVLGVYRYIISYFKT